MASISREELLRTAGALRQGVSEALDSASRATEQRVEDAREVVKREAAIELQRAQEQLRAATSDGAQLQSKLEEALVGRAVLLDQLELPEAIREASVMDAWPTGAW